MANMTAQASGWEIKVRRRSGIRWEPLTPGITTKDGRSWRDCAAGYGWDDMDWSHAEFYDQSFIGIIGGFADPHLRVPHKDGETYHRVRGKRVKILAAKHPRHM